MERSTALVVIGVVLAAGWAVAAVLVMAWGVLVDWPDYVHANYGFPLTFAVHTLDTIAGPVDRWSLDVGALAVDLSFWLVGPFVIFVASVYYLLRRSASTEHAP